MLKGGEINYMLVKQITFAVIAAVAFTAFATPAQAAKIKGNGKNSNNTITILNSHSLKAKQKNYTSVVTAITNKSNTGKNKVNGNTGGNVAQHSGESTSTVMVSYTGGNNSMTVPEGCGCPDDSDAVISGNGRGSDNTITQTNTHEMVFKQKTETMVVTAVENSSNTGGNEAKNNTGSGVLQTSGESTAETTVEVETGDNEMGV